MGSVPIFVITIAIPIYSMEKNHNYTHNDNRNISTNRRRKLTLKLTERWSTTSISVGFSIRLRFKVFRQNSFAPTSEVSKYPIFPKMYENERIFTDKDACISTAPLDPPLPTFVLLVRKYFKLPPFLNKEHNFFHFLLYIFVQPF